MKIPTEKRDVIWGRLQEKSVADLKALLEICKKEYETDAMWEDRMFLTKEVLMRKIEFIFDV